MMLCVFMALAADAHESLPAYLEFQQTGEATYDMLWKVPAKGDNMRLGLYVRLPADCKIISPASASFQGTGYMERSAIHRAGGLDGAEIYIEGLTTTLTDVLVRIVNMDGSTQVFRATPSAPSLIVAGTPNAFEVVRIYLMLGIEHILGGIDHLLFVLALLLIVGRRWMRLIKPVTAFTVAHSITLALATLGFIHVPQAPIEAIIALSIVFVASEILHTQAGRPGLTARAPWIVAFSFGLLHGFGFAGALSEVGLPQSAIPAALLFFNIGVEVGQLLFVAAAVAFIAVLNRMSIIWPKWAAAVPAYFIGSLSMFWVIQRIVAV